MQIQKTLYILRHAKAEAGASSQDDHERALVARGVKAAQAMGEYMAKADIRPEKILCSTAARARQTWENAEAAFTRKQPVEYTPKLYLASANETLSLLAHTPESVHSLLIVGHNPGFHQLAFTLAKEGDKELLGRMHLKFPTCTLATVTFDGAWKDIVRARGTLAGFVTPETAGGSN